MYYSVNQPPPTISQQSSHTHQSDFTPLVRQQKRRLYVFLGVVGLVIFGGGAWWYGNIQTSLSLSQTAKNAVASPQDSSVSKPEVAGVSFGDLLKKQRSYSGWVAGVTDGSVVVMNPQSGEINQLTAVESSWFGPISNLVWSPDRSKLAYLVIPTEEAQGFNANPQLQAQKMGLSSVPNPQTFPFGRLVVLDINTKQVQQTGMEVRNTPKSVIWLDENRLAAITSGLSIFNISDLQVSAVAGAGVTDADSQLQSPLAWDAVADTIYFTKVKKSGEHGVRMAVSVAVETNTLKEIGVLKSGRYEEVSISRSADLALDAAGERLAYISETGIVYLSLVDGGVHALPPQDDWLWLKDSILFDVEWLSASRITFTSLVSDGSKVWAVWDIPESKVLTFGRGSDVGSWDKASGRLALISLADKKLNILTPNWNDALKSTLESYELPWQSIAW